MKFQVGLIYTEEHKISLLIIIKKESYYTIKIYRHKNLDIIDFNKIFSINKNLKKECENMMT